MEKEIIMYDAPDIVEFRTNIEGWVSKKDRRFFGTGDNAEHMARYHASTHSKCECGAVKATPYIRCDSCRHKSVQTKYAELPFKEWDGKTFLCTFWDETYFQDEEALYDYCYDNEIANANELNLVICAPNYLPEIQFEQFEDEMPEDMGINDVAPDIYKKIIELNKEIHAHGPISWSASKVRTTIDMVIDFIEFD